MIYDAISNGLATGKVTLTRMVENNDTLHLKYAQSGVFSLVPSLLSVTYFSPFNCLPQKSESNFRHWFAVGEMYGSRTMNSNLNYRSSDPKESAKILAKYFPGADESNPNLKLIQYLINFFSTPSGQALVSQVSLSLLYRNAYVLRIVWGTYNV